MKLIELHILQSFPVSCLNRDDVGSPKTAVFGGVQRARLSSQCLKRAARVAACELAPNFQGIRSRFLKEPFTEALLEAGVEAEKAATLAQSICETFSKQDAKHEAQVTTAVFLAPSEIKQVAKAVANGEDPKKAAKKVDRLDAADISLFGRMVANDATLNVEGAAMFSHALSTHKATNEIDFYSAVDDRKADAEDAGAGMIGTLEFTSATYYRYAAVNLDLLFAESHLGKLSGEEKKAVLAAFIQATLTAIPGARKNSMNAATLPFEVLGIFKSKGQPIQLINAFESPVQANGKGLAATSLEALRGELTKLKTTWGIEQEESWLTEIGIQAFLEKLTSHVE
jgi:CRISPR system Cascade subunit CasC